LTSPLRRSRRVSCTFWEHKGGRVHTRTPPKLGSVQVRCGGGGGGVLAGGGRHASWLPHALCALRPAPCPCLLPSLSHCPVVAISLRSRQGAGSDREVTCGRVHARAVSSSEGKAKQNFHAVVGRERSGCAIYYKTVSWFSIDLGKGRSLSASAYTVRHGREDGTDALRTWELQGSHDAKVWVTIKSHDNDTGLTGAWATATWLLDYDSETPKGYQMFRSLPCPLPLSSPLAPPPRLLPLIARAAPCDWCLATLLGCVPDSASPSCLGDSGSHVRGVRCARAGCSRRGSTHRARTTFTLAVSSSMATSTFNKKLCGDFYFQQKTRAAARWPSGGGSAGRPSVRACHLRRRATAAVEKARLLLKRTDGRSSEIALRQKVGTGPWILGFRD